MGLATNILMSMLLINFMLLFAYPTQMGGNTEILSFMSTFGLEVDSSGNVTEGESFDSGNTLTTMFGLGAGEGIKSIFFIPSLIYSFFIWFAKFMGAPYVIATAMGAPPMVSGLLLIIYVGLYVMAMLELVLGRR